MTFRKNVGTIDRLLRLVLGSVFLYFGLFNQELIKDPLASVLLVVFGVMLIAIAIIAICPFYAMIDFSSTREQH